MSNQRLPLRGLQPADRNTRPSLPGIDQLMSGMPPDFAAQHQILRPIESRDRHMAFSEPPSPATRPRITMAGHRSGVSSAYPINDPEPPTPVSSRSSSIAGSGHDEYVTSEEDEAEVICKKCSFACSDSRHVKSSRKNKKERRNREDQGEILRHAEDLFSCTFDWKPFKAQSSGNNNSSGLVTPKIEIMRLMLLLCRKQLEPGLTGAIKAGREQDWKHEMLEEAHGFLEKCKDSDDRGDLQDPCFHHSWMSLAGKKTCRGHMNKSMPKLCLTHPHGPHRNWVDCRKEHRYAPFHARKEAFKREMQQRFGRA